MSDFKTIPLSKITVPANRSREVDEDHALAIQASIIQQGQITPVLVRKTPNGKRPYELIAGAHRHRAIELLGEDDQIDCLIVSADKEEAAILEVSENIFRNELTKLDRAVAVQIYRDAWEKKNGKITRGGDQTVNLTVCLTDLLSEEASKGFAVNCAERLGLSVAGVERANRIAKNLPKPLIKKLRNTPAADNQQMLLRFASLEPAKLKSAVKAIEICEGDIAQAIDHLEDQKPVKPISQKEEQLNKLVGAWSRASNAAQREFMDQFGLTKKSKEKEQNIA